MRRQLIVLAGFIFLLLYFFTDSSVSDALVISLFLLTVFNFMHLVGRGMAILDLWACVATLELLFIPFIAYSLLPDSMPVDATLYFTFTIPATIVFLVGLYCPLFPENKPITYYIKSVERYLVGKERVGLFIIIVGIIGNIIYLIVPLSLQSLFLVAANCVYIGVIYMYFSSAALRVKVISIAVALSVLLVKTVQAGMFGELVFWLLIWALLFSIGKKWVLNPVFKMGLVVFGLFFILLLQSLKFEYRMNTWIGTREEQKGDAGLMLSLIGDRLNNLDKLFNVAALYESMTRFNQGRTLGSAMGYVPVSEPYANGEILLALTYPFIPRILWSNKPMTGGLDNIRRFTNMPIYEKNSINITPFGEAYVNFGIYGGIIYMFFFGLIFNWCFNSVLKYAEQIPSLILWLPGLFIRSLTFETDLYTTWGSFVQASLFAWIFYGIAKLFKVAI
jgi:hypothetical protein